MTVDDLVNAIRKTPINTLSELTKVIWAIETRAVTLSGRWVEEDMTGVLGYLLDAGVASEKVGKVTKEVLQERRQDWLADEAKALRKGE